LKCEIVQAFFLYIVVLGTEEILSGRVLLITRQRTEGCLSEEPLRLQPFFISRVAR